MSDQPTLYLVDGSSYLYRAFHALPNLTNAEGEPTGALFGVANMLRRLVDSYQPTHAAVIFDAPGKNFRHEAYPDYKANRPPMPDELRGQIRPLHELVLAMGLPLIVEPGVEADDVIATLTAQARKQGFDVLISSGDKDLAQLVGSQVTLEDTMQEKRYDSAAVEEKFGVPPTLVADLLALTGDTSDNIPGVEKVGPKTAAKWLNAHGSLDEVMENADSIGGKVGDNLKAALDQIPLSRRLVALKDDVAINTGVDELKVNPANPEKLVPLLKTHGFSSWLKEVSGQETDAAGELEVVTVTTRDQLDELVTVLEAAELIAVDSETTSINPMEAEPVGLAFSLVPGKAWYVPLAHADQDTEFDRSGALKALAPVLTDPARPKVGQHLKYDLNVLFRAGIELAGIAHDTMLESYVYNSTATRHDLDSLAGRYLNRQTTSFQDVAGKGRNQLTFDQVPVESAADYAGEDTDVTLCLHHKLWPRLKKLDGPRKIYEELEIPLIPVLARMERHGVKVDADELSRQSADLSSRMESLQEQAFEAAGEAFNPGSPKQLQAILFEKLELPVVRKTPKGQPSTAEDVLVELARDYELPSLILEHRGLSKLKSTYTDTLPRRINPETGRIHTSYHQAVAATGRLSSTEPNLQNIPIRKPEGRRIRKAFIAEKGYVLLAADYSQIELRIMAHLSGDEGLLKAFAEGADIHRATAAEVFGESLEKVTDDQRRAAKAINFGLMYGMSGWGLSRQLEIPRKEAETYIETYFERYPGVRAYMEKTRESAREKGYVETLRGRRLWLEEINSRNGQRRQAAERAAINAPMQGSAADIIKQAMLDVDAWLESEKPDARMIMQVHDELVLEVAEDALESVRKAVVERMNRAAKLEVDLVVDTGSARDWDGAH